MSKRKILLIEDDRDVRENTAEILELANYEVVTAENGRRGVEHARMHKPDLVLCDIMMPELDGYGVLHLLGRDPSTAEIPFIFLSAKAERGDVRKGMELGADDYLTKPFEESELLNAIEGRLKRSDLFRKGFEQNINGLNNLLDNARSTGALGEISKDRKVRNIGKKETIYNEGDELRSVFFINKGKVRTFKMNNDGKEFVTGLHSAGDFLGYMSVLEGGRTAESAETLEECELAVIPREEMLALMYKDRDVSIRFIKMLTRDVKEKEERLLDLAYSSVRQRVAQAILRIRDRYSEGDGKKLGVKISREDLATIVGTATESLIRTLSDLKEDGLIEMQGREILIGDERRLEQLANK
jgi:DNA-binding response OmpR family regulator